MFSCKMMTRCNLGGTFFVTIVAVRYSKLVFGVHIDHQVGSWDSSTEITPKLFKNRLILRFLPIKRSHHF